MSRPPPVKRVRFSESHVQVFEPPQPDSNAPVHEEAARVRGQAIDSDDDDERQEESGVAEDSHLTEDNIEGQEEATIANDDGIAITPFNLREEMQEGYFDSTGCYIFNKEDKEIHDNWLDNVDWGSVKETKQQPAATSGPGAKHDSDEDSSSGSGDDLGPAELSRICAAARAILSPGGGETVAAAIKRLGGGANRALTASQRLRLRKAGGDGGGASGAGAEAAAANRQRMLELSELAGRLVSAGHMAAYQMDAGQLARLGGLGSGEVGTGEKGAAASSSSASGAGIDMFASDEEEGGGEGDEASDKDQEKRAIPQEPAKPPPPSSGPPAVADEVSWLYRVADSPDAEVLGPFNSQQMLDWSEGDTGFPGGHRVVFVRKVGTPEDAPFYSSARIDFDLYV